MPSVVKDLVSEVGVLPGQHQLQPIEQTFLDGYNYLLASLDEMLSFHSTIFLIAAELL